MGKRIVANDNSVGSSPIKCSKSRKYYPDFYLPNDDKYIEIKNYCNSEVEAKCAQFPHKLDVLYEAQLTTVFEYVRKKYGKDYVSLYEPKK